MMEFLVMPQLTSSLVECFSASTSCDCNNGSSLICGCNHWTCTTDSGDDSCPGKDCNCLGNRTCTCNGNVPVCITDGCWAKTCVMNYSINGT